MTSESTRAIAADIARELREHPQHWTQGGSARTSYFKRVSSLHSEAVSWCLMGHRVKRDQQMSASEFTHGLGFDSYHSLIAWNDAPERTVSDIIALCEKVAANG